MILIWIIAIIVPALAVLGGPWLVGHLDPGRSTAFGDPVLILVQFFLAASPLLALAIFSLVRRAEQDAVSICTTVAGLATLVVWGWYHAGAIGVNPETAGLPLLASPVIIGILALALYQSAARPS